MYQTKNTDCVLCLVGRGAGPFLGSEKWTRVGGFYHHFLWGGGFWGGVVEAGLRARASSDILLR